MSKPIHIHLNPASQKYEVSRPAPKRYLDSQRDWARLAMYQLCGIPNDPLSPPLPLAVPRNECDCVHCPPPARVRIENNGGLQPTSVTPRPIVRTPTRQASSLCTSWVPPHYHKFFCAHDRFRGLPCGTCGRSTAEGREWLATV
jgi:hypothetical protein